MENPLTPEEEEIMNLLVQAYNKFQELTETHPIEKQYFMNGIHLCQSTIIDRIVRRDYPNYFYSK